MGIADICGVELLALGASGRTSRQVDDETYVCHPFAPHPHLLTLATQGILASFFKEVLSKNIGDFQNLYNALTPEEQHHLSMLR